MIIHLKNILNVLYCTLILLVVCLSVPLSLGQEKTMPPSVKKQKNKDLCTLLKLQLNNCPDVGLLTAYLILKSEVNYSFPLLVSATAKKEDEKGNIYKLEDNHHHSDWIINGWVLTQQKDTLDYICIKWDDIEKKIKIQESDEISDGLYSISFKLPKEMDISDFFVIELSFTSSFYSYDITSHGPYCLLVINLASLP
ncbi:MAG: hypothetical protein E7030_08435 [Akkermansiaceae bacterium]|nr:hypothetical protein [Akkermansiaceae bacterium]